MDQEERKKVRSLMQRTWLSCQQAAEYLGISKASMYRLFMKKELLPNGLIGGKKKFSRTYLDRVVRANGKAMYPESEKYYVEEVAQFPEDQVSMHFHDRQQPFHNQDSNYRSQNRTSYSAQTDRERQHRRRSYTARPHDEGDPQEQSTTDFKTEIARLRKELDSQP